MNEPFNLPPGVTPTDIEDDPRFISLEDADWERELEMADDRENDDPR